MAPLEGDTLGKRHHHYNKMVKEAIANSSKLGSISDGDQDTENLLKIDVASKTTNVNYILEVLKCEDMLYVSRAIKQSTWLITEEQYAHIINPGYLHMKVFPQMTTKAINKLMLHIRLNLRDHKRVESFYAYQEENNPKNAVKWLQNCSLGFIENAVEKRADDIPIHLLKCLCEKSINILEIYIRNSEYNRYVALKANRFLIYTHTEKFLDIAESLKSYEIPPIGPKFTDAIMKNCPERVLNKFDKYINIIDMETFVKHLKTDEVTSFLLKHAKIENLKYHYKHFIKRMPKEGRFEFIKKIFIDKDGPEKLLNDASCDDFVQCSAYAMRGPGAENTSTYSWYQFAPFDVAFLDLKKLIRTESSPSERSSILIVLLTCAGGNLKCLQSLLQYYYDKHINEPFKFKIKFVNKLISITHTHMFDDKMWNILNQIFHSMEVYIESEYSVQSCLQSIIIHNVIRGEKIPEIIEKKFEFDSLKSFHSKLNQKEKNAVFHYLYKLILTKIQNKQITSESIYRETILLHEKILNLLNDWQKDLHDYPIVVDKIKELVRIKKENSWNISLASLYNVKKSWKRYLFEESIILCPSEKVLINALKHDPELLRRSKSEVEAMCCNDAVSLKQLLSKLKIYWSESLAVQWANAYVDRLDKPGGHNALIVGLCILLPQKQLMDIIKKYIPTETKINWGEADQLTLSLRKQIAKNMHLARPQVPVEAILWYAKGDYLQYAVLSLDKILHNLSCNKYHRYFSMLLDAPVSLQKYGIRFAFNKINFEELKPMFSEVWNSTKNSSIRTVLFTHTYKLLCKEKNPSNIDEIWKLLSMFIDNLKSDENKIIYNTLGKVNKVPHRVKAQYYMKSYSFLISLPAKANCESTLLDLGVYSTEIMELIDSDFVADVLIPSYKELFSKNNYESVQIITSFLLCVKEEETQIYRYERILAPRLEPALSLWNEVKEGEYYNKNITHEILRKLAKDLRKNVFEKKMNIPINMFSAIQLKLEKTLPIEENYVTLTIWKLVVAFVRLLGDHKYIFDSVDIPEQASDAQSKDIFNKLWLEMKIKIAPLFGKVCLQFLKEDIDRHFPSIYLLFADALQEIFNEYLSDMFYQEANQMEILKHILGCENVLHSYLLVYKLLPSYIYNEEDKAMLREIRKILYSHPSTELKMHYCQRFEKKPDLDIEN